MFLYDRTDDIIDVYSMIPNIKKIVKYRKIEADKFSDFKFLRAVMRGYALLANMNNNDILDESQLNYNPYINEEFHELKPQLMLAKEKQIILHNFYNGSFDYCKIIRVQNKEENTEKYLLITKNNYKSYGTKDIREMRNIISIPESLYLLQMLLQGNFNIVKYKNIHNQLKQFDISTKPVQKFYVSDIERLSKFGLLDYDEVLQNVEVTKKILNKVRW